MGTVPVVPMRQTKSSSKVTLPGMVVNPATICIDTAPQSSDTLIQIPQKPLSQITLPALKAQSNGMVSLAPAKAIEQNKGSFKMIN